MLVCEKCGAALEAGGNWYRNKGDHVCCDCSSYPYYPDTVSRLPTLSQVEDDYEGAVLERQDDYYGD